MKKIIVFILLFATIMLTGCQVKAALGFDNILNKANQFINNGDPNKVIDGNTVKETSNNIYGILLVIGVVVAIIAGIIIGIQFVTGSVEAKAQIKEKLIPYGIGCAIIFGAFTIWRVIVNILQNTN